MARWTGWTSPLQRLRLRHKLAVSLSLAALLPVVVASWVAVSVVLRSLENGLRADTDRQLHVGLNLLLRNVERIGADAVRLSSAGDLSAAMSRGAADVADFLARESAHLPSSLVQIADESGTMIAERVVGGVEPRFAGLRASSESPSVKAGLGFERRVTIVQVGEVLLVRAAAPIVDASFMLQGVVVVSVPLDGDFADGLKGALGTDVLIFAGVGDSVGPAMSTFLDPLGARTSGIRVDAEVAERIARKQTLLTDELIRGGDFALGYTPLMNLAGEVVGIFAVAVDRAPLLTAKSAAMRSLALGAAGAFIFALGLAGFLSRRLTGPIARLHRGAIAIARGDLDHQIKVSEGDEIGDLATAFSHMTKALKENQERLAARMREIVALHDAGRAVSSVINLEQVLRKIVDSVARVFEVRLCALWLVDAFEIGAPNTGGMPRLRLGAARAKAGSLRATMDGDDGARLAEPLSAIAVEVAVARATLRVDRVSEDPRRREAAIAAGVTGSILATPLERKGSVVGVIIIGRARDARSFTEADSNLLATFADQAATAVENARLYEEVRAFNEELEQKVRLRTQELTAINAELGRTITELRETQAQLILSERLAGLGLLVAGVAHEINSPSAAIRGSVDAMSENVSRLTEHSLHLAAMDLGPARDQLIALVGEIGPELGSRRLPSAVTVHRAARELRGRFVGAGIDETAAAEAARGLAEMGADDDHVERFAALLSAGPEGQTSGERARVFIGYLMEHVYLHRNALTIQNAIKSIQRIVGALKSYSHLDQEASLVEADLHEGIEDTLVILEHLLRDITVTRNYGQLPRAPIYVDELNQVWTNLIHNAVQALQGQGSITIETRHEGDGVAVAIIDDGPGIPEELRSRIFEPFFTTKAKGEGTGLGLRIVQQIVDKHHGNVTCDSRPGRTCFEVWLPLQHPRALTEPPRPPASELPGEGGPQGQGTTGGAPRGDIE